MIVKTQHDLQPSVLEAHSVIVEDRNGTPIMVAIQIDANTIMCSKAGDPDFNQFLKTMGVDKTFVVRPEKPKPIENVVWTP